MAHLLSYARVSTAEQNADLQTDELTAAGCWKVFTDQASGAMDLRPELDRVLVQLRPDADGLAGRVAPGWGDRAGLA
ncbi:MAG: recombinase family protein [Mycobacteriales bacterium]